MEKVHIFVNENKSLSITFLRTILHKHLAQIFILACFGISFREFFKVGLSDAASVMDVLKIDTYFVLHVLKFISKLALSTNMTIKLTRKWVLYKILSERRH